MPPTKGRAGETLPHPFQKETLLDLEPSANHGEKASLSVAASPEETRPPCQNA